MTGVRQRVQPLPGIGPNERPPNQAETEMRPPENALARHGRTEPGSVLLPQRAGVSCRSLAPISAVLTILEVFRVGVCGAWLRSRGRLAPSGER